MAAVTGPPILIPAEFINDGAVPVPLDLPLGPPDPTGPQYPPFPAPGSNGIGTFRIGQDQIGGIPDFEWIRTVCSQYANSPILMGIIERFFDAANQTQNFETFYDDIWNVFTAQGYGLDVWGRIVGINRILQVVDTQWFGFEEQHDLSWNTNVTVALGPTLGFAEGLPDWKSFGWGVFGMNWIWSENNINQGGGALYGGHGLTHAYKLSDRSYRFLIMAKAAQNITDCSIPSINQILLNLFYERGNAFVTEGYLGSTYFGFQESKNAQPFNQEAFYNGEPIPLNMQMTYTFDFALSQAEYAVVANSGVLPKPTGVNAKIVVNPPPL